MGVFVGEVSRLTLALLVFGALILSSFLPLWPYRWWWYVSEERSIYGKLTERYRTQTALLMIAIGAAVLTGVYMAMYAWRNAMW